MPEPHTTQHGSPCARTWTPDWIAVVEAPEQGLHGTMGAVEDVG